MAISTDKTLVMARIVSEHCDLHPDLDALTFVNVTSNGSLSEEVRTYQQLWDNGQRIAAALDREHMIEGEAFGLLMHNHPEFVDAMVGASITNTVFVPIDPRTKPDKLSYMLGFSECRGVIVADYALGSLLSALEALPALKWVWVLDSSGHGAGIDKDTLLHSSLCRPLDVIYSNPVADITVRANDPLAPMQYLYTSGTTGDPKAIVVPHVRFSGNATMGELFGLRPGDRPYTGLSLTHANAQIITLGMGLYMGLRMVISRKFSKSQLWNITRHYGCTSFNLLGGMTTAIYSEAERDDDADNPVRFVLSAGMPANLWDSFQQRFDIQIFEFYGAAEGGITINPPGVGPKGSIGKPLPGMEARILDDNDRECAPYQAGEVVFRSVVEETPLKVHYLKNSEASRKKTIGGWLRMGDMGYCDEAGWLYFMHRSGGGVRRNGDFIDTAAVEKILAEHSAIEDVFVYGVPATSGAAGEKDLVAAIEISSEASFDKFAIFEYCRERLDNNAVPSYLQIVAAIPKTASEKPLERLLLDSFSSVNPDVFTRQ